MSKHTGMRKYIAGRSSVGSRVNMRRTAWSMIAWGYIVHGERALYNLRDSKVSDLGLVKLVSVRHSPSETCG